MPDTYLSGPTGHHVRLEQQRLPLPVRVLANPSRSRAPGRTSGYLALLHQRAERDAVTFRVEGRRSRECLGFLVISDAAEPSRAATVAVCGMSEARTLSPAILDAAVVATGMLFEDERTAAVEVTLLGACRDLCHRMHELGFERVDKPRASPWLGLATGTCEAVFRMDRSGVPAVTAVYETMVEAPTAWLRAPLHPFPA